MIPDALDKPQVADAALEALAGGESNYAVARTVGCSEPTVRRFRAKNEEALERLKAIALQEGERSDAFRRMIARLLEVGSAPEPKGKDDPPAPRDRAQCARVYGEYAGLIGGPRDVTVNGDVTFAETTVNVDARAIHLAAGDPKVRAERAAELDRLLGIG